MPFFEGITEFSPFSNFWITYNPYPFLSLLKSPISASACALRFAEFIRPFSIAVVASFKLDELSEICFLNNGDFFPLPSRRKKEHCDDS